jgi:hypothetical protein
VAVPHKENILNILKAFYKNNNILLEVNASQLCTHTDITLYLLTDISLFNIIFVRTKGPKTLSELSWASHNVHNVLVWCHTQQGLT